MTRRLPLFAALWILSAGGSLHSQTSRSIAIHVSEAAGIRRTGFPVHARVPFPAGALPPGVNTRLLSNEREVPAQYATESRWPDGSIQWLDVDFNVGIGPAEAQIYQLEYGANTKAAEVPRGLMVTEDATTIQAGNLRFSKSGNPLILSVQYRGEDIASGANGLIVTDDAGHTHDLSTVESLKTEILKPGPLYVVIRYSGKLTLDSGYSTPFVMSVEMPNSKTMIKVAVSIEDPAKRLREISFHTPLAFGPLPWVWDFGTRRWTYGALRNTTDAVTLSQEVKADGPNAWTVVTGPKGKEQLYETSGAGRAELVRWGHFQDGKEVVAFGLENAADQPGIWRAALNGEGHASFSYAPAVPVARHSLTVFEHFVAAPVQIGAATSPSALLNPLSVVCERQQYILSGMEPPANATP